MRLCAVCAGVGEKSGVVGTRSGAGWRVQTPSGKPPQGVSSSSMYVFISISISIYVVVVVVVALHCVFYYLWLLRFAQLHFPVPDCRPSDFLSLTIAINNRVSTPIYMMCVCVVVKFVRTTTCNSTDCDRERCDGARVACHRLKRRRTHV